jgi:glycerate dehydrogenase
MNIVFLDARTVGNVSNLNKLKELGNMAIYQTTMDDEKFERAKDADVIITNKVLIDKELMDRCLSLKLVCVAATGVNNVDMEYASQKGIIVKNAADYSTNSVTQLTFSLLLFLINKLNFYRDYVFSGGYAKSPVFNYIGEGYWELQGKRFGIIGLGTIGKKVAQIAGAFGCEVVYFSTSGKNDDNEYKRLELETLLKTSDIISIHAPLNKNTYNLIDYEQISMMQKHAILINTGRGKIVNEAGLAKALNENLIAGAGLDVLENEPINADNPLLKIDNKDKLIITPHIAWASQEARTTLIEKVYNNIIDFRNDQN